MCRGRAICSRNREHWRRWPGWRPTGSRAISIGRPSDWGKGYGTDASSLTIRYGFDELNLHRIWLDVFGYNDRALQLYTHTSDQNSVYHPGDLVRAP